MKRWGSGVASALGIAVLVLVASACTATPQALTVSCTPDPNAGNVGVVGDPCPNAVAAVQGLVATLGYQPTRIVIEPGIFMCGVVWPGSGPVPACLGPIVLAGRAMRAWVWFAGTNQVAVVALSRDLPTSIPISSQPPWTARLIEFEVPPNGWNGPA